MPRIRVTTKCGNPESQDKPKISHSDIEVEGSEDEMERQIAETEEALFAEATRNIDVRERWQILETTCEPAPAT